MKIIDLLVKMANGEEVPRKIKYDGIKFEYSGYYKDYLSYDKISSIEIFLIDKIFKKNIKPDILLNDEVEIIEENKKIEHCLKTDRFLCDKAEMEHLRTKIDELIDEVNKLKGEK